MTSCPVVEAIKEIRGGGLYDDEQSDRRVIKLGGSDSSLEYVFDEVSYFITTRRLELARFELSRPTLAQCKSKYRSMFRDVVGCDYTALYTKIVDRTLRRGYLYDQFVQLIDLIGRLEDLILMKVETLGRDGRAINVSLPDILLLPHIDQVIVYRPDVLANSVNQIIDYVNNINVNALLREPQRASIQHIAGFTGQPPVMSTMIEGISPDTIEGYIAGMKKILAQETEVATYVRDVESYHVTTINHLNRVYDICKKMIEDLVS